LLGGPATFARDNATLNINVYNNNNNKIIIILYLTAWCLIYELDIRSHSQ